MSYSNRYVLQQQVCLTATGISYLLDDNTKNNAYNKESHLNIEPCHFQTGIQRNPNVWLAIKLPQVSQFSLQNSLKDNFNIVLVFQNADAYTESYGKSNE